MKRILEVLGVHRVLAVRFLKLSATTQYAKERQDSFPKDLCAETLYARD